MSLYGGWSGNIFMNIIWGRRSFATFGVGGPIWEILDPAQVVFEFEEDMMTIYQQESSRMHAARFGSSGVLRGWGKVMIPGVWSQGVHPLWTDWQTRLKTLPSGNFVGRQSISLMCCDVPQWTYRHHICVSSAAGRRPIERKRSRASSSSSIRSRSWTNCTRECNAQRARRNWKKINRSSWIFCQ